MPRLHDAHRRQRAQAGADRRPAHADLRREIALGRQAVARPQLATLDQGAHVRHHLLGAALAARAQRLSTFGPGEWRWS